MEGHSKTEQVAIPFMASERIVVGIQCSLQVKWEEKQKPQTQL